MQSQMCSSCTDGATAVGAAAALSEILHNFRDAGSESDSEQDDSAVRHQAILRKGDRLVAELRCFAESQVLNLVRVDPLPFLCNFAAILRHTLDEGITVGVEVARECLPWCVDKDALHEALLQLVLNARDAMPDGGHLLFKASVTHLYDTEGTSLDIVDTGSGMTTATLRLADTPFFTTKKSSPLSGMGLPAVKGFAGQSGGCMLIASIEGRGTTVTMMLPTFSSSSKKAAIQG